MRRIAYYLLPLLVAAPAFAQSTSEMNERLSRLERDLNFVQKEVYSGTGKTSAATAGVGGNTEVRFTQLAEELRQLRGQLEQAQYEARQATQALEKYRGDTDYRLQALEQKSAALEAAAASATVAAAPTVTEETSAPVEPATYSKEPAKPAVTGKDFPNSNAHYSHAFKLLNDKDYRGSAASFDQFVKQYPEDPLTANAYYWLGESYYARGDYTRAAEGFRKGFETNPEGQKAPDNLLKLAMSLHKVKRTNEACVVLQQVQGKYAASSPRTATKAAEQITAMQCE